MEIIFHRDMRVGKNTSQAASVEFLRMAQKLCAQQTATPFSEKPLVFREQIFGGVPVSTGVWRQDKRAVAPGHHKTGN